MDCYFDTKTFINWSDLYGKWLPYLPTQRFEQEALLVRAVGDWRLSLRQPPPHARCQPPRYCVEVEHAKQLFMLTCGPELKYYLEREGGEAWVKNRFGRYCVSKTHVFINPKKKKYDVARIPGLSRPVTAP